MTKMNITRDAEVKEKGILLKTRTEKLVEKEEFDNLFIEAYNKKENVEHQLNIERAKIIRLSKIEFTPELHEFAKKMQAVHDLLDLEKAKDSAKELEEAKETLEKDLINLRKIKLDCFTEVKGGKNERDNTKQD